MRYWITGTVFIVLDILSKWSAKVFLADSSVEIIPSFFSLHLAFNEGVAFSLAVPKFLQIFLTLSFFFYFFWWANHHFFSLSWLEKWGSVLLLSGAIGNFIDRVLFTRVTDFLSFTFPEFIPFFGGWGFPIFNAADVFIFIGVVFWIIGAMKKTEAPGDTSVLR